MAPRHIQHQIGLQKVVDEATRINSYTVSRRTVKEAADGLFAACVNEMRKMGDTVAELKKLAT